MSGLSAPRLVNFSELTLSLKNELNHLIPTSDQSDEDTDDYFPLVRYTIQAIISTYYSLKILLLSLLSTILSHPRDSSIRLSPVFFYRLLLISLLSTILFHPRDLSISCPSRCHPFYCTHQCLLSAVKAYNYMPYQMLIARAWCHSIPTCIY